MEDKDIYLNTLKNLDDVLWIIQYGSSTQGIKDYKDIDYMVIVKDNFDLHKVDRKVIGNYDFNFYTLSQFNTMMLNNDISCLEAYVCEDKYYVKGDRIPLKINPDKVREQCAKVSSNSWVKAKKKLTIDKDYNPYIALKSLYHSMRILALGTNILGDKEFSLGLYYYECIQLHKLIFDMDSCSWEKLDGFFREFYNKSRSCLRASHKKALSNGCVGYEV